MLRGQYTYTATSRPGVWEQAAGWKVQSAVAAPGQPPPTEQAVRAAVRKIGGFVPPAIPQLAAQEDVDALPRCLRLDPLEDHLACLNHVVAAGPDSSGRPNFFAHGLLLDPSDEEVDEEGLLRPGDLWGSGLWLRPLGLPAVERAEPDPRLEHLERGPLDASALAAFTRRHPDQRGLVLAAFERHVRERAPLVVVGGDSAESVAQWVRLLGMLLLPAIAWRTQFSTYERLRTATGAAEWPFAVVGVPASDAGSAESLPGASFAVLHDDRPPLSSGPGRWRLPDGTELAAGRWAQLAENVVSAGLLPEVTQQVDALAIECRDTTNDRPLWALGAAVLLLDPPMEELDRDAAELTLDQWPADVELGPRTTELLLARLGALISPPGRMTRTLLDRSRDGGGLAVQLAFLGPVRAALADPAAYERLGATLTTGLPPLSAGARRELDDVLADALAWVPLAGSSGPHALLSIAALVDRQHGEASVRAQAVQLAHRVLLPALLAEGTDPVRAGWPPVPGWLWVELRPALAERLSLGQADPGLALTPVVHAWLGGLSLPRGPLTAAALEATGPVEWERAAYAVFRVRPRPQSVSPLERAAAFLATVNSSVINEGSPEDRWAASAVEDTYTSAHPLDLPTATVLMHCVPENIPFWRVLVRVLEQTVPSTDTAQAVALLREREDVPDAAEVVLERYEVATGSALLITSPDQVLPLAGQAVMTGGPTAWVEAAEAVLRLDVDALPLTGLPRRLGDADMPWDAGWELLDARHPDPADRLLLAGNLLCRTARVEVYPAEDQARLWLSAPAEKDARRGEAAAAALLAGHEAPEELIALVERLTREVHHKQVMTNGRQWTDGDHPDQKWRWAAVTSAQQIVRQLGGSPLSRALRRNRP